MKILPEALCQLWHYVNFDTVDMNKLSINCENCCLFWQSSLFSDSCYRIVWLVRRYANHFVTHKKMKDEMLWQSGYTLLFWYWYSQSLWWKVLPGIFPWWGHTTCIYKSKDPEPQMMLQWKTPCSVYHKLRKKAAAVLAKCVLLLDSLFLFSLS